MRNFRILLLHFQRVLEFRTRILVWFGTSLINPIILILFWKGAVTHNSQITQGWTLTDITSYYLLLIIAGSALISHPEGDIATYDIKEGGLVKYLIKPFSYYSFKIYEEIPWRLTQGIYGLIALTILIPIFAESKLTVVSSGLSILLSIFVILLAFMLSFTFKMILGILAFWLIDIRGVYQTVEVTTLVLGGFIMPIYLMPTWIGNIAVTLPFSYMTYYPVIAVQGKLSIPEFINVIGVQIIWFLTLFLLYKVLWSRGVKKFTAVGQ